MITWSMFRQLLFGYQVPASNVVVGQYDDFPPEGRTRGDLFVGDPGSGKTGALARILFENFKRFNDRAIFVLDWSGAITDLLLMLILSDSQKEELLERTVYDELGNHEWVVPLPEFSEAYGGTLEEQVQRVSYNLIRLAPELVKDAPFLAGLGLREIAPQIFRLLSAITNEHGESWQVTEAKRLILDPPLTKLATAQFGNKVPEAKWFMEQTYLKLRPQERELRSFTIQALLGAIESRTGRARVGYYRPGWTPKEAIHDGLLVLINGARLINERNMQHYLFTQVYSLIMAEINKRQPGNPEDQPVSLVMDEVYSLLSIPGMAEEISTLTPLYRSRKLVVDVVLQSLAQLAPILRDRIWSMGNVMCFATSNFDEAYEIAQQLFKYEPLKSKIPLQSESHRPVIENDRSQYLTIANWIQRLQHRQCIVRRYWTETKLDPYIRMVPRTRDLPLRQFEEDLEEIKEKLLKKRAVSVRDALEVINQRKLTVAVTHKPPQL